MRLHWTCRWGIAVAIVATAGMATSFAAPPAAAPTTQPQINFARDVQPILSDSCFRCHGPDAHARKGDLRFDILDKKIGPFAPRDGYAIITPGSLDDSVMIMRITSDDPDVHMPPPASKRVLSEKQIDLLKKYRIPFGAEITKGEASDLLDAKFGKKRQQKEVVTI